MIRRLEQEIADFCLKSSLEDVPTFIVERSKLHVLDTLGLALAGARSKTAHIACEHVVDQGMGNQGSVIFGTQLRAPSRFSAFVNAVSAHAYNFDDTTPQISVNKNGGIHASGSILPTVLAVGEENQSAGSSALCAYLVGVEVSSRLNHAIAELHYARGFHPTGTLNTFGVTCAAAKLRGVNVNEMIAALSVAASRPSGIRRNFGTTAEVFHSGWAAENGVLAADFACRGIHGAADALQGPGGFFDAFGGGFDPDEIIGKLGEPWVFDTPGVWIKPYPNGALTHPGADCLRRLLKEHQLDLSDISDIYVRTNAKVWHVLQHHLPKTGMQAKFSMEYILSIILLGWPVGLGAFSDEMLTNPDLQYAMSKIHYTPYTETKPDYTNVTTLINVKLNNGCEISSRSDYASGSSKAPMTLDQVVAKFRECAIFGGHREEKTETIIESVFDLENFSDVSDIGFAMIGQN
tara:strand:- start:146 stop:1534 length:1389 start_codon:yes stop_codon:yes gene_type:complete